MTAPKLGVPGPWGFGGPAAASGSSLVRPLSGPPNVGAIEKLMHELDYPLPEVFPVPDAKEFNPLGSANTAAIQSNVAITGASFDVPVSNYYRVTSFTIYITNMLVTTNVQYSLLWNGQPVAGFQNLIMYPRAAPFVSNGFDCFIRGIGAGTLSVSFNNVDGGAYTVGASFSGWFWPVTSDSRWKASGL